MLLLGSRGCNQRQDFEVGGLHRGLRPTNTFTNYITKQLSFSTSPTLMRAVHPSGFRQQPAEMHRPDD